MELEEMKRIWDTMNTQLEDKEILTESIINDMTQERYTQRLEGISRWERNGAIVCFLMAIFILFNFYKLDTLFLWLSGLFSLLILVGLPFLTLYTLGRLQNIPLHENSYKETLLEFRKRKKQVLQVQKLGILTSFVLLFTSVPLAGRILDGKDLFQDAFFWSWYIPLGSLLFFFFVRWGYGCYKAITRSAEEILLEVEGETP